MPRLSELLKVSGVAASVLGNADVEIAAITADSRQVTPGALFAAMPGTATDGTRYIPDALRQGAAALLVAERSRSDIAASTTIVRVASVREAIARLAAAFYPQQPAHCYAVTGTDGKTSTADFVRQLAELNGRKAASIGTLGLRSGVLALNTQFPAVNTSPEPVLLQRTLQQLAQAGVSDVAIETSSHGLDQKRADGVRFIAGAFTNFARDHLDYHASLEDYFAAKARLFTAVLPGDATAVLNTDDARYAQLRAICDGRGLRCITFGKRDGADYQIDALQPTGEGLNARVIIQGKPHALALPFYGAFQLSNMLTAVGLLAASGLDPQTLVILLPQLRGVPGRLEKVALGPDNAPVFIDYAHTPAALENILKTLRPHTRGKLRLVFGCGGDRDAGKRPEMGRAAVQHADRVIVTDDNPRSEDPAAIRAAILAAAPGATEIPGREEAIRAAVSELQAGDVLVVAGKGHETTQTIGSQTLPFNDADEIRKAVAA